jgi:hypothetical protein
MTFCTAHSPEKNFVNLQVSSVKTTLKEWKESIRNWTCERNQMLKQQQVHNDEFQNHTLQFHYSQILTNMNSFKYIKQITIKQSCS